MKLIGPLLAAFAISAAPALAVAPDDGATLTFEIADVRASDAPLYLSLQTRDQFMQPGGAYGTRIASTTQGATTLSIAHVAPGDYAPMVWHDDNANGRFDVAEDGRPLDGWAMIGGPALTAKPTFDTAAMVVGSDDMTIHLQMIYGR